MKKFVIYASLIIVLAACQTAPTATLPGSTPLPGETSTTVPIQVTPQPPTPQPPTPTSLPSPTPETVGLDEDLADIISNAAEGDSLYLGSGTYYLHKDIVLEKTLTVIGAGQDKTTIVSDAPAPAQGKTTAMFRFVASGKLTLLGINLSSKINGQSALVWVGNDGHLEIKNSRLESTMEDVKSYGLITRDTSQTLVENCIFSNVIWGIGAFEASTLTVNNSRFENTQSAIASSDDSTTKLTLNANTFSNNNIGVSVSGSSDALINQNTFENNESAGILFKENANGTVADNQFHAGKFGIAITSTGSQIAIEKNTIDSTRYGIMIGTSSAPIIKENTIQAEPGGKNISPYPSGMVYSTNSGGEAIGNTISGFYKGISVEDNAKPVLEGNIFHQNEVAIALSGQTAAVIRGNQINETQLTSYKETGIIYSDQSGGEATGNTISGLSIGIDVDDEAKVTLEENTLTNNKDDGIRFYGKSSGAARRNHLTNCSISVSLLASATLEENIFQADKDAKKDLTAIDVSRPVDVINNTITGFAKAIDVGADLAKQKSTATMLIEGNTLIDNINGITYYFGGKGFIRNNKIMNTKSNAIQISEVMGNVPAGYRVSPVVEGNNFENTFADGSHGTGVCYYQKAGGTLKGNTFKGLSYGIYVSENAAPTIQENLVSDSTIGLMYKLQSGGTASNNKISNNQIGIDINDKARPNLKGNEIFSNTYSLAYSGSSSPSLTGNNVHDNTHDETSQDSEVVIIRVPTTAVTAAVPTSTPLAVPTATSSTTKMIRLYYPNIVVALKYEHDDTGDIDPQIHLEILPGLTPHTCSGNYAYIEKEVPNEEYSLETALKLLFSNKLSDEEKKLGFANNLSDITLVSQQTLVDSDGKLAKVVNQLSGNPNNIVMKPGTKYMEITLKDQYNTLWTDPNNLSRAIGYHNWVKDLSAYTTNAGGICYWETVNDQINATILQFYPLFQHAHNELTVTDSDIIQKSYFYNITDLAYYGCQGSSGKVCAGLPAISNTPKNCYSTTIYGRNYYYCQPDQPEKTFNKYLNLTAVCLTYPGTPVCEWPEVKATLP